MSTAVEARRAHREPAGGVGADVRRPDGTLKVTGRFAFSSDLWAEDMIWGATVRSPHPRALIGAVDASAALRIPGVRCVLTHEDVPGRKTYGLEVADQPVLAIDQVRYQGEPVAIVAADDPETARRGAAAIRVEYTPLAPVLDPALALRPECDRVHPDGNVVRHLKVRRGDPFAPADVVVSGEYEVGMQDQAFLGPESGLAIPAEDGGVDLYIATQWLHVDQDQVATSLDLPPEKVRLTLSGVGGAFGAREDLSLQIHLCLLALRTGRPVKMVYSREESFFGHVHRHPARLRYTHGADRRGRLVFVKAEIVLDGGAYMSSSRAVVANAGTLGVGPYDVPNVSRRRLGRLHQQPALRGHAGVRGRPGLLRLRVPDGQAGRGAGAPPRGGPGPQRHGRGLGHAHWPGRRPARPGGRAAATGERGPAARRWCRPRLSLARRGGQHDPRRGGGAGHRVCRRVQERRVLRGFRRLLDRPGDPELCRRPAHRLGPHRRVRGRAGVVGDPGADRPHRAGHRTGSGGDGRHPGGQRRVVVGLPPDVHDRRGGAGRLRRRSGRRSCGGPPTQLGVAGGDLELAGEAVVGRAQAGLPQSGLPQSGLPHRACRRAG